MTDPQVECPRCGSTDVEAGTTIDLTFGEEIPCKVCKHCGNLFDHGTPSIG
jgi:transcription elongation factor Elf1